MQPSSDQESGGEASSPLRRYGPVVAIVAVVAVIIGLVVSSGGDDDDTATDGSTTPSSVAEDDDDDGSDDGSSSDDVPQVPDGAISYSMAEDQDLLDVVTFPETCDLDRGTVAIPTFFAPECYANVDDNGGATHRGVTGDAITVVYYVSPEVDPTLDFITGPINNDDTPAEIAETVQNYVDMYNDYYQLYGRQVDLKILNGSGPSEDETAAIADAQRAIEEFGAFAVWGGPALTNAWTKAIADEGVICLCGAGNQVFADERAPFVYGVGMGSSQLTVHATEYVSKKLAGKPALHAGDESFHDDERTFGLLYISTGEESERTADQYEALLKEDGVELTERVSYDLIQLISSPEVATNAISKFKAAGVTTILLRGDPVGPSNFTQEATAQEYFPEWVVTGGTLVDTTVFGRVYDQPQWQNAFGITGGAVDIDPTLTDSFTLHEWYTGEPPPAAETAPVLLPNPGLFFAGLQAAGPNLTPETFRDGLFAGEPTADAITNPSLSYGDKGLWDRLGEPTGCRTATPVNCDWAGVDDMTEFWWDFDEVGPDELNREGTGMLRFVKGGKRYLPGAWDTDLTVFSEADSVVLLSEPPESERPPVYPSPAG